MNCNREGPGRDTVLGAASRVDWDADTESAGGGLQLPVTSGGMSQCCGNIYVYALLHIHTYVCRCVECRKGGDRSMLVFATRSIETRRR